MSTMRSIHDTTDKWRADAPRFNSNALTSHFAFTVAYFLFALMLLSQIADVVIAITRAW